MRILRFHRMQKFVPLASQLELAPRAEAHFELFRLPL